MIIFSKTGDYKLFIVRVKNIMQIFLLIIATINSFCLGKVFDKTPIYICVQKCEVQVVTGYLNPSSISAEVNSITVRGNVSKLRRGSVENLPNLKYIKFEKCKITQMYPDTFKNLSAADEVILSFNDLRDIHYGVFTNRNFRIINLGFNQISEIDDEAFGNMPRLEEISLMGNQISAIQRNWFKNSPNIKSLTFAFNQITDIEPNTFLDCPNLEHLLLHSNKLTLLPMKVFAGIGNLKNLYLSNNNIRLVYSNLFTAGTNITRLHLEMNRIHEIKKDLFDRINVKIIHIHPNPLSCPCLSLMREYEKLKMFTIVDPYDDDDILWDDAYLRCIKPKNRPNLCSGDFAAANDDLVTDYYNKMNFTRISYVSRLFYAYRDHYR